MIFMIKFALIVSALLQVTQMSILDKDYVSQVKNYTHSIENVHNEMRKSLGVRKTIPFSDQELNTLINLMPNVTDECYKTEQCARNWFIDYHSVQSKIYERDALLSFEYSTNITDYNAKQIELAGPISNKFTTITKPMIKKFLKNCREWNPALKRMLFLSSHGLTFSKEDDAEIDRLFNKLKKIYADAKVCEPSNAEKCFQLDPDLTETMAKSRNYSRLLWAWKGWHDATGPAVRNLFTKVVSLSNKAARENNYTDLSQQWIESFETKDFEKMIDYLYVKIKPFYHELHTYVRRHLNKMYKDSYPSKKSSKYIQAHLLGNMWSQSWENIYDLVKPYPTVQETNLDDALKEKNFSVNDIVKSAEKFFVSMGLFKMNPTFWNCSMFEKPANRSVLCHATAINMFNGYDFRVKMCAKANQQAFQTIHHEMGHIQYYIAYRNQSIAFKNGANSAFHEAIGDTIGLSAMTPKHLKAIGLIENGETTYQQDINFLMKMALRKVAFLPFSYVMEKWRWNVFRGKIGESSYNEKWWQMKREFQGIEAPVGRSENDFDAGSKYHMAMFVPYSRYFLSYIYQFQFYKSLCSLSGHKGDLHKCDFYGSKEAGAKLKKMLALGSSRHWSYALNVLTEQTNVNYRPLFEYFKPLYEWLRKENANAKETIVN